MAIAALPLSGDCLFASPGGNDSTQHIGSFTSAVALAVDPSGFIFVLDAGTHELLKLSPAGEILQSIGGYGWSQLTFDQPSDVIAPNGLDIYVADYGNHRIQRFDRNCTLVSVLPQEEAGSTEREFGYPRSVSLSRLGALFVIDGENIRVLKINTANAIERTFGDIGGGKGSLHSPSRVRVSENNIVFVQDGNGIVAYDYFGNYLFTIARELFIHLITFTVHHDTLVTLDSSRVRLFDASGTFVRDIEVVLPSSTKHKVDDAVDIDILDDKLLILFKDEVLSLKLRN